jgi:CubicO group peptidase (beta-lactamase class C family)
MIDLALYSTVWVSLVLFVAGEAGKSRQPSPRWALAASAGGAMLLAIHIGLSLDARHAWSHDSVVRTVEAQARAMYGFGWGGGAWMNYAFLALWLGECIWWAASPRTYRNRPRAFVLAVRAFYLVMLINAAILFAAPSRRIAGAALSAALLWIWRDTFAFGRTGRKVPARAAALALVGAVCAHSLTSEGGRYALAVEGGAFAVPEARTAQRRSPLDLDAARAAAAELPRLHSLLVSWRGSLIFEYHGKGIRPARATNVKSVSKSILSALLGIAIGRRIIPDVDTPISKYFPEIGKDRDPRKRQITVEDLVSMRAGLESTSFDNYGAWVGSRNWVQYALSRPMLDDPGESMEYSTGNTHLLSAILTRATRMSTHQFAQQALGKPLGISIAPWPRDPQGIFFGGNDMLLTPSQMVKFGELYLAGGRAGGRQIVPAAWVETSCVSRGRSRFNPDQGYGYGWWTREFAGRTACFAWGFGGQYIFTFRDLDLVVVTTSSTAVSDERRDHRRQIFDILERHIVPAIEKAAVP